MHRARPTSLRARAAAPGHTVRASRATGRQAPRELASALAWLTTLVLLVSACGDAGVTTPPHDSGIAGTVRAHDEAFSSAYGSSGAFVADLGTSAEPPHGTPTESPDGAPDDTVIPGEILIVFAPEAGAASRATVSALGTSLTMVRALALPDAAVYRAAGAGAAETVAIARALALRHDVLAATPNRVVRSFAVPNDTLYESMWSLAAIGMPAAWELTTGSADVVVAVVDTGVHGRPGQPSVTHPDLAGKLLPGFDFVSFDDDPFDTGTFATNGSHGTHVAGIIAARTNDASGIAGIDWSAMLLPVRVLDEYGSGSLSDVLDGVAWAAGISVPGVPANAHPADVINVSLGGRGVCSSVEQYWFDRVAARGAIVVAAAGNGGEDARATTPASCDRVIAVGATDREGQRAWYSNFGPAVALMAPGGDMQVVGPDGERNGILSAVHDGTSTWKRQEGTSMAAPHVAGVAALMRAKDPGITPAEVAAVLRSTAAPMSASECNGRSPAGLLAADCGAGLLDAPAALLALGDAGPTPPPPPDPSPDLRVEPDRIDFGSKRSTMDLTLRNRGESATDWSLVGFSQSSANPGPVGAGVLSVDVGSGRLPAGASRTLRFVLDRDELPRAGSYRLDLVFAVDGEDLIVPVHFEGVEGAAAAPGVDGTLLLVCAPTPAGCDPLRSVETVLRAPGATAAYAVGGLDLAEYVVIGWNDRNGSGTVDAGDLFGFHTLDGAAATPVTPPASGVDLTLRVVTDDATAGAAGPGDAGPGGAGPGDALEHLRSWLAAP